MGRMLLGPLRFCAQPARPVRGAPAWPARLDAGVDRDERAAELLDAVAVADDP
jgi:hypothetical protein